MLPSNSNMQQAIQILQKADMDFRGGDPELAQQKKEEKQQEAEEMGLSLGKAGPGEESGSFRGGDPELLQEKREEAREEAEALGEIDEGGDEADELDPDEVAAQAEEEELKQEEKAIKALPTTAHETSPVDSLEDYKSYDYNGDPLENKITPKMKNIEICPPRQGQNQWKPWSEALGLRIPMTGEAWVELRRYTMSNQPEKAEQAKKLMLSMEAACGQMTDIQKAGFERLVNINHGLTFDPNLFGDISKAEKFEVVPGHKYIYRWLENDGWHYQYTGGSHNNHGIHETANRQGHTVPVHPEYEQSDPEHQDPEGAFHHAREKALVSNLPAEKISLVDPKTEQEQDYIFKITKPKKGKEGEPTVGTQPIHLYKDEGKDPDKLQTKDARKFRNFDEFEGFVRRNKVHTEKDIDGKPWLQWREGKGGKIQHRFVEGSPHAEERLGGVTSQGWSKKGFKNIDAFREHVSKQKEKQARAKAPVEVESLEGFDPEEHGTTWTKTIEDGALKGRQQPVEITRTFTDPKSGAQSTRKQRMYEMNWNSGAEKRQVRDGLYNEHKGMIVHIADKLLREANIRRLEEGNLPHSGKKKSKIIGRLMGTGMQAINDALNSYDETKSKFSTHLYNKILSRQMQLKKQYVQYMQDPAANAGANESLFYSGKGDKEGRYLEGIAANDIDAVNNAMHASEDTPDIEFEDIGKYKEKVYEHLDRKDDELYDDPSVTEEEYNRLNVLMEDARAELDRISSPQDAAVFYDNFTKNENGGAGFVPPIEIKNLSAVTKDHKNKIDKKEREDTWNSVFGKKRLNEELKNLKKLFPKKQTKVGFHPEINQRIKGEGLKTLKDLLHSVYKKPLRDKTAIDRMQNVANWLREDPTLASEYGEVESMGKALRILKAAQENEKPQPEAQPAEQQEQPEKPDVHYVGKVGDHEAPTFLYEAQEGGNVVQGTNAPLDHPDYDPNRGEPVVHEHEVSPENHPEYFDEQGKKLNRPIPHDTEVETNENYDPDKTKGNFWVKRFQDPETGESAYAYYHRDQVLDPRLRNNTSIRHFDAQLPKIRAWYQQQMMSAESGDRAAGLLVALADQAKLPIKNGLQSMTVGQVKLGNNKATFTLTSGKPVEVTLDRTPMKILQELTEGKDENEVLFSIDNNDFDYFTFANFLKNVFGVDPSAIHAYQVTELFSKEFNKLTRQGSEELTMQKLDEYKQQALKTVAEMLHEDDPLMLEQHLDPIAMEALYLAAHLIDRPKVSKGAYKLQGKVEFQGLPISIENKKGSVRKWYDPHNKQEGKTKMNYDYGYVRMSRGVDGDHVDVYLGPNPDAKNAYVVHQMKAPDFTKYDEDKVMLGWDSEKEAKAAYLKQYDNDRFFGSMSTVPMEKFKEKVKATKDRPQMIKSWHVAVNPPERDPDEKMFSEWLHSYPLHEHYFHWGALQKKKQIQESEDAAHRGIEIGTKKELGEESPEAVEA